MAGTLQLDFLQPQSNTGLYILSPTGSTMASINTAGIYSATGGQMFNASGNFVNPVISSGSSLTLQTANTTAITVDTSQNVTFAGYINSPNTFGFKNRIINGAMVIDQRNAGASVTPTGNGYTLDRYRFEISQSSKFSVQQNAGSVTPPTGFTKYLGITSLSAYSISSTDYFVVKQSIEGNNIADLGWGASGASAVTLSFKVYSSLTGTFGGVIQNADATRSYPFTYTISSANTWTSISITIAGDTTGTWQTGTSAGIIVYYGFGVGSTYSGTAGAWASANYISATGATSVVGTNGATFYLTGVQFEAGSTASPFEYRQYGTELALCQRYYETSWSGVAVGTDSSSVTQTGAHGINSTDGALNQSWRVNKRSNPTCYVWSPLTSPSANKIRQGNNGAIATVSSVTAWGNSFTIGSNGSTGYMFQCGWSADSEL